MKKRSVSAEDGFTLVELLVVLAIIGLVAALVAPQVLRYLGTARVSTTQAQLKNIGSALELYYLDVGSYPSKEQGLNALVTAPASVAGWNGPYLKSQGGLKDGWGRDFLYDNVAGQGVRIYSLGRDGAPQGSGLDADIEYRPQ
ncbi:MAG: type II secretion system protein GspG [Mesorhizobium sp.]|uniref:type II secretion system major pseudopilin GspG n=1 Tax=Mesorhizobium sp. TaxID=1871066 RepID=UPI000FE6896E|nr:type II secretion system major pseudopilin GspG [Mesorhizobium sp.]RWM12882.1 MAG: type II secretion system protein GspG [Mesorhizobium sp.]